jgi:hypothetical protein
MTGPQVEQCVMSLAAGGEQFIRQKPAFQDLSDSRIDSRRLWLTHWVGLPKSTNISTNSVYDRPILVDFSVRLIFAPPLGVFIKQTDTKASKDTRRPPPKYGPY